jgi:hypothetical protein
LAVFKEDLIRSYRSFLDKRRDADRLRTALMECAPIGLVFMQLMLTCELSRYQARRGLAALRDPLPHRRAVRDRWRVAGLAGHPRAPRLDRRRRHRAGSVRTRRDFPAVR